MNLRWFWPQTYEHQHVTLLARMMREQGWRTSMFGVEIGKVAIGVAVRRADAAFITPAEPAAPARGA